MNSKKSDFVKFEQVDKSYDGKELVVKGLDLDIAEGEFLTLLGPSGSGKTTTLMMLAGFETQRMEKYILMGVRSTTFLHTNVELVWSFKIMLCFHIYQFMKI